MDPAHDLRVCAGDGAERALPQQDLPPGPPSLTVSGSKPRSWHSWCSRAVASAASAARAGRGEAHGPREAGPLGPLGAVRGGVAEVCGQGGRQLLVRGDLPSQITATGHNYSPRYVDGWTAALPPTGYGPEQLGALRSLLR